MVFTVQANAGFRAPTDPGARGSRANIFSISKTLMGRPAKRARRAPEEEEPETTPSKVEEPPKVQPENSESESEIDDISTDDDSAGSLRDFIVDDSDEEEEEDDDDDDDDSASMEEAEDDAEAEEDDEESTPSWIDKSNIITGKRQRRAATRYVDPDYKKLMMEDASDFSDSDDDESVGEASEDGEFVCPNTDGESEASDEDAKQVEK